VIEMSRIKVTVSRRCNPLLSLSGFLFVALISLFSAENYAYDFSIGVKTIGGDLKIINWTTYTLTNIGQQKNKMEQWNFPATLSPTSTNTIRVEFGNENNSWWNVREWWRFEDKKDISGKVTYQVDCGDNQNEQVTIMATTVESKIDETVGVKSGAIFNPYFSATTSGADCVSVMANDIKGNGDLGFVHDGVVTLNIVNTK
jgi:hypothetical protein